MVDPSSHSMKGQLKAGHYGGREEAELVGFGDWGCEEEGRTKDDTQVSDLMGMGGWWYHWDKKQEAKKAPDDGSDLEV